MCVVRGGDGFYKVGGIEAEDAVPWVVQRVDGRGVVVFCSGAAVGGTCKRLRAETKGVKSAYPRKRQQGTAQDGGGIVCGVESQKEVALVDFWTTAIAISVKIDIIIRGECAWTYRPEGQSDGICSPGGET